jgi:hypothetical protein
MNCRPGRHDWEVITVEQDGRETQLRCCKRPGCERWDEMRGVWTVINAPPTANELVMT